MCSDLGPHPPLPRRSGRDKRKKKNPKPGAGIDKTLRHTERNQDKAERRVKKKAEECLWPDSCASGQWVLWTHHEPFLLQGGEDDLDALLAKFQLQDEQQSRVQVVELERPPSPRLFATFTPVPAGQA